MDKVMEVLQGNLQQRIQYTVHVHVSYVLPIVVIGNKIIHAPIRKNAMKSSIFDCPAKFQWNLVEGGLLYQADLLLREISE